MLAQLPNLTGDQALTIGLGVVAVAYVTNLVVDLGLKLRRKPSIEAEFATKQECRECRDSTARKLDELDKRVMFAVSNGDFAEFQTRIAAQLAESMGRVMGQLDRQGGKLDDLREDLNVQIQRIAGEIHSRINETRERLAALEAVDDHRT